MTDQLENSTAFLAKHNFKVLVEWMTAEVLLNRPKDPLCFLRDVICDKINSRKGGYTPEDFQDYAKNTYAEASATADEMGQIQPRKIPKKPATYADTMAIIARLESFQTMVSACRNIATKLDPWETTSIIIEESCKLLNCDRATIFTVNPENDCLELVVAKGVQKISVPLGQGVAGAVALEGKLVNIPDAYADARFNSSHDVKSGYETKSILACPIKDLNGKVVGVIQVLNRKSRGGEPQGQAAEGLSNYQEEKDEFESKTGEYYPFIDADEEILELLAAQAGIALFNANMYQAQNRSQEKVRSLLDIIKAMHSDLGVNSLLFTITERAHQLVEAKRCTMFLLDEGSKELWSLQGEVNLRIPMNKGIAGECCVTNQIINIPDAYSDSRFNQEVDKKSGFKTKTILCMPCRDSNGTVVGVIQLINKREGMFTEEDVELMTSFLYIAGPLLAQSQLFLQKRKKSEKESVKEFVKDVEQRRDSRNNGPSMGTIIQEEEEEEEEEEGNE